MGEGGTGPDSCLNTIILADLWQMDCKRTRMASKKGGISLSEQNKGQRMRTWTGRRRGREANGYFHCIKKFLFCVQGGKNNLASVQNHFVQGPSAI